MQGLVLDLFAAFIGPLEDELETSSSHTLGRAHGMTDIARYDMRISAMNFAMDADDGHGTRQYDRADVILTGVRGRGRHRRASTSPLQYGIFAANYPLAEEDLESGSCPGCCAGIAASCTG